MMRFHYGAELQECNRIPNRTPWDSTFVPLQRMLNLNHHGKCKSYPGTSTFYESVRTHSRTISANISGWSAQDM
jgi:hypothetical protein